MELLTVLNQNEINYFIYLFFSGHNEIYTTGYSNGVFSLY